MTEIEPATENVPDLETMSEEQLGDLLAAVGNHEGKAILMLAFGQTAEGEMFGTTALHSLITNIPGSESAYVGNLGNQKNGA